MSFESWTKEVISIIFQQKSTPRAKEGRSIIYKNSLEPQAEEERNHSQPRAKEEGNIISNIVRKSEEVARLSKTLNLMRKKVRASVR